MPASVRTPLGASTTQRKWQLDVNTGTKAVPIWIPVDGMTGFNPGRTPGMQEDSDFDGEGFESSTKTSEAWQASLSVRRGVQAASSTSYDPGQEFLRLKSEGKFGVANAAEIRYYEMEPGGPRVQAYQGTAAVGWSENDGDMKALSMAAVTLTGQGKLNVITHPDTVPSVPVVVSVLPATAGTAGGTLATIKGDNFTGVTAVTVGGTAATSRVVVDDETLVIVVPAHAAGSAIVVVTNVTGPSTGGPSVVYS